MDETILVIFTALCSGLIATVVTIWWQKRDHIKAEKVKIFTVLMSKRYDIAAQESVEALNMLDVVFYSSDVVHTAWREFNDATNLLESPTKAQTISDKYLRLLEVIADDIGYKNIRWEDIKRYYYPMGLSERQRDEAVLRRVQIDAGIAQLNASKNNAGTAQTDKQNEFMGQVLLEAVKNPDSLFKIMEAAEKAQNINKELKNNSE